MSRAAPRPVDATDERLLGMLRKLLTHGQPGWAGVGPEVWTQLTLEKMLVEELGCESWAGVPADWMRPAVGPLLRRLAEEGWAGTRREPHPWDRGISGDSFWRAEPLLLSEWAAVAEAGPYWFPWRRAVLERGKRGPHLDGQPRENPVVAIAADLLRDMGPSPAVAFLRELGLRAYLACGGDTGDVATLAAAVGRGLLRDGVERMRERGGVAFVVPPAKHVPRRSFFCAPIVGFDRAMARAFLGLEPEPTPELLRLKLPPRAPAQLRFGW